MHISTKIFQLTIQFMYMYLPHIGKSSVREGERKGGRKKGGERRGERERGREKGGERERGERERGERERGRGEGESDMMIPP